MNALLAVFMLVFWLTILAVFAREHKKETQATCQEYRELAKGTPIEPRIHEFMPAECR